MVKLLNKNKPVEEKTELEIKDKESLNDIINNAFSGLNDTNGNADNSAKDLETAKIVIGMIMNPLHLNSTSNLSLEEIDDLSDAYYLNLIFDNPLIAMKIKSYIELKRSQTEKPRNLLNILSDIVGKGIENNEQNGIGKFLGDRFR